MLTSSVMLLLALQSASAPPPALADAAPGPLRLVQHQQVGPTTEYIGMKRQGNVMVPAGLPVSPAPATLSQPTAPIIQPAPHAMGVQGCPSCSDKKPGLVKRLFRRQRCKWTSPPPCVRPVEIGNEIYEPRISDIRDVAPSIVLPGADSGIPETLPVLPARENGYFVIRRLQSRNAP